MPAPRPDATNPDRADDTWPSVVIAGAYRTGVLAMRTLWRRNVRASCVDCNPAMEGFRTPYGRAHLCPNQDTDPEGWAAFMVALASRSGERDAQGSSQMATAATRTDGVRAPGQ